MAFEIERKFLVKDNGFIKLLKNGKQIKQGYLSLYPYKTVRIRLIDNVKALITIKSKLTDMKKFEFEYQIPVKDALELLENICIKPIIDKQRFAVFYKSHEWVIDVFRNEFEGVVLAEIELSSEDEAFELPNWVGLEVTDNPDFHNTNMLKNYLERSNFKSNRK